MRSHASVLDKYTNRAELFPVLFPSPSVYIAMDWFYAEGKQRHGPVDEAKINALIAEGVVKADTLVWNKTMTDWRPAAGAGLFRTTPPGMEVCFITGKVFPTSHMIKTEHGWVSAEARDTYYQSIREGVAFPAAGGYNAFADGKKIVVPVADPRLPLRCIKTNQPIAGFTGKKKTLYWCTPVVYLSILLSIIVLLILYLILRKKVVLDIPLSPEGRGIIRKHGFIACGILLGGLALTILPAFFSGPMGNIGGASIALGLVSVLTGFIYASARAYSLRVTKVDKGRAWLAGACPEYVASLPRFTG